MGLGTGRACIAYFGEYGSFTGFQTAVKKKIVFQLVFPRMYLSPNLVVTVSLVARHIISFMMNYGKPLVFSYFEYLESYFSLA